MTSTRIFRVLSQLTIPELNRFNKFIQSPYHNVNARIIGLAVLLIKSIKNNKKISNKEEIWETIEVKMKYSDLKFRKLCNDLLERFEKFLIIENLEEKQFLKSNLLLDSIRKNKYQSLAEKHLAKSSKEINRSIDKSSDFFLQKYFYEKTIQNLKSNYEKKVDLKKGKLDSYDELSKNLDAFYIIEKLRIATDMETWKKMYKSNATIDLGVSLEILDNHKYDNIPSVDIYRLMYSVYKYSSKTKHYFNLKAKALKHINSFPKDEQREIFDVLVSYCIKWVNKGDMEFHKETLEIYDWGIQEEINLIKGKLSPTSFRNYVVIGLRVGAFDKVERFIKNNIVLINEDRKENALNFNLARVEFYRKKFDEVLSYLNKVNYDDIWYNLNSKMLLLATYYELNEFEVLESTVDAFILFCRRDKIIDAQKKTQYFNFAKSVKKLTKFNSDKKLITLKEKIESTKVIGNKTWLLEKIDELLT